MKKGFGPEVCAVLDFLLVKIFAEKKLGFKNPIFPETKKEEDEPAQEELEEEEGLEEGEDDLDE